MNWSLVVDAIGNSNSALCIGVGFVVVISAMPAEENTLDLGRIGRKERQHENKKSQKVFG